MAEVDYVVDPFEGLALDDAESLAQKAEARLEAQARRDLELAQSRFEAPKPDQRFDPGFADEELRSSSLATPPVANFLPEPPHIPTATEVAAPPPALTFSSKPSKPKKRVRIQVPPPPPTAPERIVPRRVDAEPAQAAGLIERLVQQKLRRVSAGESVPPPPPLPNPLPAKDTRAYGGSVPRKRRRYGSAAPQNPIITLHEAPHERDPDTGAAETQLDWSEFYVSSLARLKERGKAQQTLLERANAEINVCVKRFAAERWGTSDLALARCPERMKSILHYSTQPEQLNAFHGVKASIPERTQDLDCIAFNPASEVSEYRAPLDEPFVAKHLVDRRSDLPLEYAERNEPPIAFELPFAAEDDCYAPPEGQSPVSEERTSACLLSLEQLSLVCGLQSEFSRLSDPWSGPGVSLLASFSMPIFPWELAVPQLSRVRLEMVGPVEARAYSHLLAQLYALPLPTLADVFPGTQEAYAAAVPVRDFACAESHEAFLYVHLDVLNALLARAVISALPELLDLHRERRVESPVAAQEDEWLSRFAANYVHFRYTHARRLVACTAAFLSYLHAREARQTLLMRFIFNTEERRGGPLSRLERNEDGTASLSRRGAQRFYELVSMNDSERREQQQRRGHLVHFEPRRLYSTCLVRWAVTLLRRAPESVRELRAVRVGMVRARVDGHALSGRGSLVDSSKHAHLVRAISHQPLGALCQVHSAWSNRFAGECDTSLGRFLQADSFATNYSQVIAREAARREFSVSKEDSEGGSDSFDELRSAFWANIDAVEDSSGGGGKHELVTREEAIRAFLHFYNSALNSAPYTLKGTYRMMRQYVRCIFEGKGPCRSQTRFCVRPGAPFARWLAGRTLAQLLGEKSTNNSNEDEQGGKRQRSEDESEETIATQQRKKRTQEDVLARKAARRGRHTEYMRRFRQKQKEEKQQKRLALMQQQPDSVASAGSSTVMCDAIVFDAEA